MLAYLQRMALYNQWANRKLFTRVAELPSGEFEADHGISYSSILGTFNHIYIADVLWLIRFASSGSCDALSPIADLPMPTSMHEELYFDLPSMAEGREDLDELIMDFSKTWTDEMLATPIRYRTLEGEMQEQPLGELLQSLFNHHSFHRGEIAAVLAQTGVTPGSIDLVTMMEES